MGGNAASSAIDIINGLVNIHGSSLPCLSLYFPYMYMRNSGWAGWLAMLLRGDKSGVTPKDNNTLKSISCCAPFE